ncbi:O-antigen ligase family protein [Nocardioides flavescens]|uniref:O-antigen ligase-related domain-containing protein n=1 Tax=Nocardioides flavescens TaxID=2691959 RepID=A0A6L7ER79_9ACTN|nr:O-antigen ligase family protein [Nocardioides flavescens]MXG89957.1 hypothetical protein [Nocardioides flavescens]
MTIVVAAYALLLAYPSELVLVGPLRSNGGPVRLLGLLAAFLLVAAAIRVRHRLTARPVAGVLFAYLAWSVFAWGVAHRRPLTGGASAYTDRTLLAMVSAMGIALLCTCLVHTVRQAHLLVGCLVGGACVSAVAGILQFAGLIGPWADVIALPFNTTVVSPGSVSAREGLARVSGAAAHPIEYAVVLAMVLPVAVHLAVHAASRTGRRWAAAACVVILIGFPLGLSRSGLLAVVVCLVIYSGFLPRLQRAVLLGGAFLTVALAAVLTPQVTTVFTTLITGAGEDNSVTGRLDDYPRAVAQWAASPWLGGAPADITVRSSVLDNQWLATLVATGVVGALALAVLLLGPVILARRVTREAAAGSAGRSLAGALAAPLVAAALAAGTFDLLAFQQVTFLLIFLAALIGVRDDTQYRCGRSGRNGACAALT